MPLSRPEPVGIDTSRESAGRLRRNGRAESQAAFANVSPFQLAVFQAVLMTCQSVADACSSCPATAWAYLSKVVETRLWSRRRV
jgi:hypothetical protein